MVELKPSSPATSEPKPRYGHLSKINPSFAEVKDTLDAQFKSLWALPLRDFKQAWLDAPVPLPEGCPQPGKDIDISDHEAVARDGTKLGIRVYKSIKTQVDNATLYFKAHGGGELLAAGALAGCTDRM